MTRNILVQPHRCFTCVAEGGRAFPHCFGPAGPSSELRPYIKHPTQATRLTTLSERVELISFLFKNKENIPVGFVISSRLSRAPLFGN
jgi:hypothetical protein